MQFFQLHYFWTDIYEKQPFLDPAFWQALKKARGWKRSGYVQFYDQMTKIGRKLVKDTDMDNWLLVWVRFTLHLADDKDANSFFASLARRTGDGG